MSNVYRRARRRAGRCGIDRDVHDVAPVALSGFAERDGRFNVASRVFQVPVSAKDRVPSIVVRGCDIGTGQNRERVNQVLPFGSRRQITPVKQKVGVGGKCISPPRNLAHVTGEIVRRQPRRTQLDRCVRSVRDDVYGIKIAATGQSLGDLIDPVTQTRQQHNLDLASRVIIGPKIVQQLLVVFNARVEKNNFVGDDLRRIRRDAG